MSKTLPSGEDPADLTAIINRVVALQADGADHDRAAIEAFYDAVRTVVRRVRRPRASRDDPQTTDLLHRVWERLIIEGRSADAGVDHPADGRAPTNGAAANGSCDESPPLVWSSREQFFAAVARTTMSCLVDDYRRRTAHKRGGDKVVVSVDEHREGAGVDLRRIARSDQVDDETFEPLATAIGQLQAEDPRAGTIVVLRFFGDLTLEEIALGLGVSERTVKRDWRAARIWLFERLGATYGVDAESAANGDGRASEGPAIDPAGS